MLCHNLDMSLMLSYFVFLVVVTIVVRADFQENCLKSTGTYNAGQKLLVRPVKVVQDIECEFVDTKLYESTRLSPNANYVYGEVNYDNRTGSRTCGDKACNNYSTCISTSSGKNVCIATECADPVPLLENGIVISQTYSPPSVTFGCNKGYIAVGQINTTTCVPGGRWSPLSLICESLGPLRLSNGTSKQEGRVEMFINGTWGTICDDNWTENEASVVCAVLGFTGLATPRSNAYFGGGTGPIWLDGVKCSGSETHLLECEHLGIGSHNCAHREDAGVTCG